MNRPTPSIEYSFNVLCIDRDSGQLLWNKTVTRAIPHEGGHSTNTYSSGSPVTDGRFLWCNFGSQGVWCLDLDGNVVWSRDLGKMATRNQFGEGASLAIYKDVAVIPWDQERNSFILAVNALTGEDLWRKDRDEVTSWATPTIVERAGRVQVITNGGSIRSYDLYSGELLWEAKGQTSNPIPTPLVWKDRTICMTGHRGFAMQAVDLSASGDISNSEKVVWNRTDSAPYIASPVLIDDSIYFVKGNSGILSSVSAVDGSMIIGPIRLPGVERMYASLVSAGENIYACGREGSIIVFKHGSDYEEIHRTELGEPIDATPAISGNLLIIRGHKSLYCFEG
jgi:outer membrane protein assembly factor BamB